MSDARQPQAGSLTPGDGPRAVRVRRDTIVAVATAPGRSALAVVRVSGPDAEDLARRILDPWPQAPRMLCRCRVHGARDRSHTIDDALAVVFPAPASYTGETVVEVHTHGGTYIPGAVVDAFVAAGARPALAGEFTERAVLNGKLDLVRAETVGALIDARTSAAHRAAIHALSGALTHAYADLRDAALALDALIAFDIDFPEEDHGPLSRDQVTRAAADLRARIDGILRAAPTAQLARDGALVVLAGPPNAGKSTLLNAMIGETRAIVSDEPGTTRDAIEVLVDGDPWPMRLVDTAGLRSGAGTVERLGIEVSERYLQNADIVILCAETCEELRMARARIVTASDATIVAVRTKADLGQRDGNGAPDESIDVCAVTGDGLAILRARIMDAISSRATGAGELPVAAVSARQRAALETASAELQLFIDGWTTGALPAPVAGAHLRGATNALDHLIGTIEPDDVLGRVFATFCVGK